MNKKDEVKIKVLSEIRDDIVDPNTTLRAKLLRKPRMNRNKLVAIYAIAACILLIGGGLLAILPSLIKQVPIYQGMTVSHDSAAALQYPYPNEAQYLSVGAPSVFKDGKKDKEEKKKEQELESAARETLEVKGADSMYYANPGEDVYVTVHISNPDDFEILSFTLNGKKYSSYMFEAGSDMEHIIIKVSVGEASGISEYTIDAIKYVDGTEIKDVRMDGERTVRIGVYTENQPTAGFVRETVLYDGVSFEARIEDAESLIALSEGELYAVLYDGEQIVETRPISLGDSVKVSFENLKHNTPYRYAVIASYDPLDGTGFDLHVLAQKEFTTLSALSFASLQVAQTEVTFALDWNEQMKDRELLSLKLYQKDVLVRELALDATKVDGLLSNTAYTLVAEFTKNGVTERSAIDFTTMEKATPEIQISHIAQNEFTFEFVDPDAIGTVTGIELTRNGEVITTPSDFSTRIFNGLTENSVYRLKVDFTFDLNDGKGVQSKTVTKTVVTLPKAMEITQVSVFGSNMVSPGNAVFLRLQFNNPDGVEIKGIEIGGKTLQVIKSGAYYECVYTPTSTGGKEEFQITGISFVNAANQTALQKTEYVNNDLILVAGQVSVENFYIDEYFHVNEDTLVATVVFKGSEPYEIDAIICNIEDSGYDNQPQTLSLTKISDTVYTVKLPWTRHATVVNCQITQIKMKGGVIQEIEQDLDHNRLFYVCKPFGTISLEKCTPISTPEELQNMQPYGGYKLVNDIDMTGVSWEPYALQYVHLEGNGFVIKNFAYSSMVAGKSVGMFTDVSHCHFNNVVLENASVVLWETPLFCGILAGSATSTIFEGCRVEGDIRCGDNVEKARCGGFVGRYYRSGDEYDLPYDSYCMECVIGTSIRLRNVFLNCEFRGTIKGTSLNNPCAFMTSSRAVLINCTSYSSLPLLMDSTGSNSVIIDCKTYPYEP